MTPHVLLGKIELLFQINMAFHYGQKIKDDLLKKRQKLLEIFCMMSKDDISLSYKYDVICGLQIINGLPQKNPLKDGIS